MKNLRVWNHIRRKMLVESLTSGAPVDLAPFFKWETVHLEVIPVEDNPQGTATEPFRQVDVSALDLRAAIGNALSGAARVVLAEQITFTRGGTGTAEDPWRFVGDLKLTTQPVVDYLWFPAPWANDTNYAIGAQRYRSGRTWKAVKPSASITSRATASRARTANVATIVTGAAHGIISGSVVSVAGLGGTGYNVNGVTATVINATTFTYPNAGTTETTAADTGGTVVGVPKEPGIDAGFWAEFVIEREPLFLELTLVEAGSPTPILHAECVVVQPVMEDPLVPPELLQDTDAFANALAGRVAESSTIRATRAQDAYDPTLQPAPTFVAGSAFAYQARVWEPTAQKFCQAVRELKLPVRLAATVSVIPAFKLPGTTIDSVTLLAGDRVLLTAQSAPAENGLYICTAESGLVRATDATGPAHFPPGMAVVVTAGGANAGKRFHLTTTGAVVVGTTALAFAEAGGTGNFLTSEVAYWAEAKASYNTTPYNAGTAYVAGNQFTDGGKWYHCITAATGVAPTDRRSFGELLGFATANTVFLNLRIAPGRGLYVLPGGGVGVDFTKAPADTWRVASQAAMLALDAKQGDFAVRSDQGSQIYQLTELPASTLANWEPTNQTTATGATIATVSRARATNVATLVTGVAHGLVTGNQVNVASLGGTGYNAAGVTVTVVDATTFTYASTGTDEATTADASGQVTKLIPVMTAPVTLGNATPSAVTPGDVGNPGIAPVAAREDHRHPAPPLADEATDGFISKQDMQLLRRLGGSGSVDVGFDAPVRTLLVDGGRVFVGGEFLKYGTIEMPKVAKLDLNGKLDTFFAVGTGFTQPIDFLARAGDGDLVAGTKTTPNSYQGVAGGLVWKLDPAGTPDGDWSCPDPIHTETSGVEELRGLSAAGPSRLVLLTPRTFRIVDLDGGSIAAANGSQDFSDVLFHSDTKVLLASRAYSSAGVGQDFAGTINPKGLKLIDVVEDAECGCAAGHPVASWNTNAGTGANASCKRMALGGSYPGGPFIVVGTPRVATEENGVDHSWNGGNSLLFRGLFKIKTDGTAADDFDVNLGLSEAGAAIPFAIDSLGRIYFGGPVSSINGISVTPWRLYRITQAGVFDKEFTGFNAKVLCLALASDNVLIVGGEFTQYNNRKVGRITFLNAAGEVTTPQNTMAEGEGRVLTAETAPDIEAHPEYALWLWRKPSVSTLIPPVLSVWNDHLGMWQSLCDVCALGPSGVRLANVVFEPAAGYQIPGGGLAVRMASPGFNAASIVYTTNGSDPTAGPVDGTIRKLYDPEAPPVLTVATTVRAFAKLTGHIDSGVSSSAYDTNVMLPLPLVQFDPPAGTPLQFVGGVPRLAVKLVQSTPGVSLFVNTREAGAFELYQSGITTRARASNVATLVTRDALPFAVSSVVTVRIAGMSASAYNATTASATVVDAHTLTYANSGANESTTAEAAGVMVVKPDGAILTAPQTVTARAEKPGWLNTTNTADYALAGALDTPHFHRFADTIQLSLGYPAGVVVRVKIAYVNDPDWTIVEDEDSTLPGLALLLRVGAKWVRGVATDPNGIYKDSAPGVYRVEDL